MSPDAAVARSAEVAPCAVEAKLWRECLKEFDYGPDRPKQACESQRGGYYTCIKAWTERTQGKPYSYHNFEITKACNNESERLHHCMMMNMFEVTRCQPEMTLLKRCAARHDDNVRRSLQDDPAVTDLTSSIEDATGVRWLWYKALGKL